MTFSLVSFEYDTIMCIVRSYTKLLVCILLNFLFIVTFFWVVLNKKILFLFQIMIFDEAITYNTNFD